MNNKGEQNQTIDLEALRSGERHEFARLVEAYSPLIYRLAHKILENEQDADDVLQETFIKAFRHVGDFDGRSSIGTWLYRIATNEALMQLRRQKHVTVSIDETSDQDDEFQAPRQIVDWCCLPEEEMMSVEARRHLEKAVHELPESLRVVFVLRDIEGLSTAEAAQVLNISEMALKTRLSRARLRLRELLSEYYAEKVAAYKSTQEAM